MIHFLSRSTALRIADARQNVGVDLDPILQEQPLHGSLSVSEMRAAVNLDLDRDVGRLMASLEALPSRHRIPTLRGFGLDDSLLAGAYAIPPQSTGPHLFVTLGAVLAVEELLLQAFCTTSFFRLGDPYRPDDDQRILRVEVDGPEGFYDYRWLTKIDSKDERIALLTSMPLKPSRVCQFELLRELALNWLFLHEAAHWLGGHLGLLEQGAGDAHAALQFADPPIVLGASHASNSADVLGRALSAINAPPDLTTSTARKVLELQADSLGFLLLSSLQRGRTGAFRRYTDTMKQLSPRRLNQPAELDRAARARALLVAAGAVILLVEKASRIRSSDDSYPAPFARLLNVQFAMLQSSPFADRQPTGAYLTAETADDPKFQIFLKRGLARSLFDLSTLAEILRVPSVVESSADGPVGFSKLIKDLMAFFDATLTHEQLITPEAGQLYVLQGTGPTMLKLCEPYREYDPTKLRL
jgi:hypothetical protein